MSTSSGNGQGNGDRGSELIRILQVAARGRNDAATTRGTSRPGEVTPRSMEQLRTPERGRSTSLNPNELPARLKTYLQTQVDAIQRLNLSADEKEIRLDDHKMKVQTLTEEWRRLTPYIANGMIGRDSQDVIGHATGAQIEQLLQLKLFAPENVNVQVGTNAHYGEIACVQAMQNWVEKQRELQGLSMTPAQNIEGMRKWQDNAREALAAKAMGKEWQLMSTYLDTDTQARVIRRGRDSIERLLKLEIFRTYHVDTADVSVRAEIKNNVGDLVKKWLKLQDELDKPTNKEMKKRLDQVKPADLREVLAGRKPVDSLIDGTRGKGDEQVRQRDVKILLRLLASPEEQAIVFAKEARLLEQKSSTRLSEDAAKELRRMDQAAYHAMLLGKILPHQLRQLISPRARGVTWELIKKLADPPLTLDRIRQMPNGRERADAESKFAKMEQRKNEVFRRKGLDSPEARTQKWNQMLEGFRQGYPYGDRFLKEYNIESYYEKAYGEKDHRLHAARMKTWERLQNMPRFMVDEIFSIDLSPNLAPGDLKINLRKLQSLLHPDDLYPMLKMLVPEPVKSSGANAHWITFQEIIHVFHDDRLKISKASCVGVDVDYGLPIWLGEGNKLGLGRTGKGKTSTEIVPQVRFQRTSDNSLLVFDTKDGEIYDLTAGQMSRSREVRKIGGKNGLRVNLLAMIPVVKEFKDKLRIEESRGGQKDDRKIGRLREQIAIAEDVQDKRARFIAEKWLTASITPDVLAQVGATNDGSAPLSILTKVMTAALIHLREVNPQAPFSDLLFMASKERLFATFSKDHPSPSAHAQELFDSTFTIERERGEDGEMHNVKKSLLTDSHFRLLGAAVESLSSPEVARFTAVNEVDFTALLRGEWAVYWDPGLNNLQRNILAPTIETTFLAMQQFLVQEKSFLGKPEGQAQATENFFALMNSAKEHNSRERNPNVKGITTLVDEGGILSAMFTDKQITPNAASYLAVSRSYGFFTVAAAQSTQQLKEGVLGQMSAFILTGPTYEDARRFVEYMGVTRRGLASHSEAEQEQVSTKEGKQDKAFGAGSHTASSEQRDSYQETKGMTEQEVQLAFIQELSQLGYRELVVVRPTQAPVKVLAEDPDDVVERAFKRMSVGQLNTPISDSYTPDHMIWSDLEKTSSSLLGGYVGLSSPAVTQRPQPSDILAVLAAALT